MKQEDKDRLSLMIILAREDSFANALPPIEQTNPEWRRVDCPVCGAGCYVPPATERLLAENPSAEVVCSSCYWRGR